MYEYRPQNRPRMSMCPSVRPIDRPAFYRRKMSNGFASMTIWVYIFASTHTYIQTYLHTYICSIYTDFQSKLHVVRDCIQHRMNVRMPSICIRWMGRQRHWHIWFDFIFKLGNVFWFFFPYYFAHVDRFGTWNDDLTAWTVRHFGDWLLGTN